MLATGEGCLLTCIYSRLRPVREHVPNDVIVDADERLHDGIGRRELAALREREQVEQFLERQADELLVGPGRDDALDEALPSGPSALAPRATSRRPISNWWRDSFLLWDCAAASTHIPNSAFTLKAFKSESESSAFSNPSKASESAPAMASRRSSRIIDLVKPFSSRSRGPQVTRNSAGCLGKDAPRWIDLLLLAFSVCLGLRGMSNADSRASVVTH